MQQTSHYQLNQWDFEDQILMADFNSDNQKTDAALNTLAGQVAQKANSSTVNSLTTKVNAKADQSALTAEQTARAEADSAEQSAREAAVAALRNENCWVKLSDKTLGAAASSYSWAITNPGNYAELRCVFELACTGNIYFNVQNGVTLMEVDNGTGTATVVNRTMLGVATPSTGGSIHVFPMGGNGNVLIHYEIGGITEGNRFFCPSNYLASASQAYKDLSTIKIFSENGTFPAGSRFLLYGLKR